MGKDDCIVFPEPLIESNKNIYAISQLAVLEISGKDAAALLQGQITCNINDITESKSSPGALCNPKGRAIATFLLIKKMDAFLLVLPAQLVTPVKKRLQMYILRSDVDLTDSSNKLCLIGLYHPDSQLSGLHPPENLFATTQNDYISVDFSSMQTPNRYLIIAEADKAIAIWSERVGNQGFQPENSEQWRYLDIISGIPWLTAETSEEFIPQMLNLDKLGGISFNKGCYTGQEIVARTHYLGTAKRAMFLAECVTEAAPEPGSAIIDCNTGQTAGKVLLAQNQGSICKMLIVLQLSETKTYNLKLMGQNQGKVKLLTL
ncbi:YgfZ/GcvT domain-containing protein [Candidatus Methylobacter favarea]|uniref:CAF17-like 4Fe-4S cluster assembly/insertion protein YgfZ n=1 Tax=Candidatus Methylobacter favarea TaxID=2707345 RepID=UPI001FEA88E1|nr:folate-binding protein [Candidatus Methylobacter favarea]